VPRLSPDQLARRRSFLGSSDIAAIAGLDPYRSGLDVWLEKRGLAPEQEESEAALMGHLLEPVVAQRYALANPDVALQPVAQEVVGPEPYFAATVDYLAAQDQRQWVVEVKTRSKFTMRDWGPAGSDQVSPAVLAQVLWQQAMTGLTTMAEVAVLVDGREFRLYAVQHDAAVVADLMEIGRDWWQAHIIEGREPALDGPNVAAYLREKHKQALTKDVREADETARALLAEYARMDAARKEAEAGRERMKEALMPVIGDAYGIEAPGVGKMYWLNVKGRATTDWQAIAKELGAPDEVIQRHTRIGAPSRQMRFYPATETTNE
jgi:putative phage-type endonuclease